MSNPNWSRTPKHLLRLECIDFLARDWSAGTFFEAGAGTGDITSRFLDRGLQGICYDLGEESRELLRRTFSDRQLQLKVVDNVDEVAEESCEYLFAFEVLEHIQEDLAALRDWSTKLKPYGKLMISVPAHQRKYGAEDEWVGHVRRYEKIDICRLLESAGFDHVVILNYGFPLGNLSRLASNLLHQKRTSEVISETPEQRSVKSGVHRVSETNKLRFLSNVYLMWPFLLIQRLFYHLDIGDGYVVTARKRPEN